MDVLLELVIELVGEVGLQLLFGGAVEVGSGAMRRRRTRSREHPLIAGFGLMVFGAVCGVLSIWFVPVRILPEVRVPGISLVASPIISGFVMQRFGRWQTARGRQTSSLATGWGGAAFALALAATRFAMLSARL